MFANKSQTDMNTVIRYHFGRWRAASSASGTVRRVIPVCFVGICNISQARQVIGSVAERF